MGKYATQILGYIVASEDGILSRADRKEGARGNGDGPGFEDHRIQRGVSISKNSSVSCFANGDFAGRLERKKAMEREKLKGVGKGQMTSRVNPFFGTDHYCQNKSKRNRQGRLGGQRTFGVVD